MKRAIAILVVLAGCAGDQANRQSGDFGAINMPPIEVKVPNDERTPAALAELSARQDQTTQALSGLGAQVREVNARQEVQFDSIAKVQIQLQNDVRTTVQATADVKAELSSWISNTIEMNNQLRVDVANEIKLHTEIKDLSAKVEAMVAAQGAAVVGFNNRLDQVSQNLSAGRDVNNTQFTSQMASTYEAFISAFVWSVGIAALVAIATIGAVSFGIVRSKEKSRERADAREREFRTSVLEALRGKGQ